MLEWILGGLGGGLALLSVGLALKLIGAHGKILTLSNRLYVAERDLLVKESEVQAMERATRGLTNVLNKQRRYNKLLETHVVKSGDASDLAAILNELYRDPPDK